MGNTQANANNKKDSTGGLFDFSANQNRPTKDSEIDIRKHSPFRREKFELSDINFAPRKASKFENRPIQTLQITEFTPIQTFNWTEVALDYFDGVGNLATGALAKLLQAGSNFTLGENVTGALTTGASEVGGAFFNQVSKEQSLRHIDELQKNINSSSNSYNRQILQDPVSFVRNLIGGWESVNYTIPWEQGTYANVDQSHFWKATDLKNLAGSSNGIVSKVITSSDRLSYPTTPTFSVTASDTYFPEVVNSSFHLYNSDILSLAKNIRFVNSFVEGASWIQLGKSKQVSSNLFDVYCPGRFRHFICKLQIRVQFIGRTRKLNSSALEILRSELNSDSSKLPVSESYLKSAMFSDAIHVEMNFQSMMPNNMNMFTQMFLNNYEAFSVGAISQEAFDRNVATDFNTIFTELSNQIPPNLVGGLESGLSKAEGILTTFQEKFDKIVQ